MVPLLPAEPSELDTFKTIARLSLSQNKRNLPNDIQTQAISNTSIPTDINLCSTHQNNIT